MRVLSTTVPDDGTTLPIDRPQPDADETNPFGRLVAIMLRNEVLITRAGLLRPRLARATAYAADPGHDWLIADELLKHTRAAYGFVLAELRANRTEALAILRDLRAGVAA